MTDFGVLNWSILIIFIVANILFGLVIRKTKTNQGFYIGQKIHHGGQWIYRLLPLI
jgi:SSS family solute:Na+ symporter